MFKLKTLITFRHKRTGMIRRGTVFDEKDKRYVGTLVDYKIVKVVAVIKEKAKEVYKTKIVEPENKEKEHPGHREKMEGIKGVAGKTEILKSSKGKKVELSPIKTDQFKPKRKYTRRSKF